MKHTERMVTLLKKRLETNLSTQESEELNEWISEHASKNPTWSNWIKNPEQFSEDFQGYSDQFKENIPLKDRIKDRVLRQIKWHTPNHIISKRKRKIQQMTIVSLAASFLLLLAISWQLTAYLRNTKIDSPTVQLTDLSPGTTRATLKLSDGRIIPLDSENGQLVSSEKDIRYADGSLVAHHIASDDQRYQDPTLEMITITTPKGGQYKITLPDGSKVWLNAASTLTYPMKFSSKERMVFLEGEAYFDIQPIGEHSKGIFSVQASRQKVMVRGTSFNLSDYPDDYQTKTTLVTGLISIEGKDGKKHELHPNQQVSTSDEGFTSIENVDVMNFIGWKNGVFRFDETELRQVMAQLGRWYDFNVQYEGQIPLTHFYGEIARDKSLNSALLILQKSGLNFKLQRKGDQNQLTVIQ